MRSPLVAFAALMLAGSAFAAESYTMDPKHTYPAFEVRHLGFSIQRGRFDKTSGKVVIDTAAQSGSIDVTIDTSSLDMGAEDWNKHLKSEEFFNVEKFPTMTFKSNRVMFEDGKPVAAEGELTLLGISKPVKLTIASFTCGNHPIIKKPLCGAEVTTTIQRSQWGMTKFVPGVSDEVKISIPVEAYKE